MSDDAFSDDERGIGPNARQTSLAPNRAFAKDTAGAAAGAARTDGNKAEKGVFFLLSELGHQSYLMDSGAAGEPSVGAQDTGAAVFANSVAFARKLNAALRKNARLNYDPLELRYFTTLSDLLEAEPSADVADGKWATAAILTHSTFRATPRGRGIRKESGFWVMPDGVFVDDLREFGGSDDPQFGSFRDRFVPAGTLHVFACGGLGDSRDLACATRAFFGIQGRTFIPRANIQVRDGGALYVKVDDDQYRDFDPARDLRAVTSADCPV